MNFSPSQINAFAECPRCFWLHKNNKGLSWPRGAYPSLPGGMDAVIKKHYDAHRAAGLPPELVGQVDGKLFQDMARLKEFRGYGFGRGGIQVEMAPGVNINACLDDLLTLPGMIYSVLDAKARGWPPKPGDSEKYYGPQCDGYRWALENGPKLPTVSEARLAYYWPKSMGFSDGSICNFNCKVVTIQADPDRFKDLVMRAASCLAGTIPESGKDCERCAYVSARRGLDNQPDLV